MVIKKYKPGFVKNRVLLFSVFSNRYFKEDIDPESTPENVCQGVHGIGGSKGDKRLVNFIADAVKRCGYHTEQDQHSRIALDPQGLVCPVK